MSSKAQEAPRDESGRVNVDGQPALDDLMLAMDIVDTLRHDMRIAERELGDDARREALKKRLREIYSSQGIEVPDSILEEGVQALEQDRFTYTSKATGLSGTLARIYVHRLSWLRGVGLALLLGIGAATAWYYGVEKPKQAREAAIVAELARDGQKFESLSQDILSRTKSPDLLQKVSALEIEGRKAMDARDVAGLDRVIHDLEAVLGDAKQLEALPSKLTTVAAAIKSETAEQDVLLALTKLENDARRALDTFDLVSAQSATEKLEKLLAALRQSYVIRVVQADGIPSGVWRIPEVNPSARNYYLVVEAVGPDGMSMPMPVTSEETQKSETVTRWGVRVSEDIFDEVRRDKSDDGIIQNDRIAEKKRGTTNPEWLIPIPPGAITEW